MYVETLHCSCNAPTHLHLARSTRRSLRSACEEFFILRAKKGSDGAGMKSVQKVRRIGSDAGDPVGWLWVGGG
eukprot:m.75359 g.75359  ORF g.75359 m.75359 type:complete len:73 (+) comp18949_c1_seq1:22-240(+)